MWQDETATISYGITNMSKSLKNDQIWLGAKKKYRLSDELIQMAKRLGMNPKKIGSIANHKQERWKQPLPDFIRSLYEERFSSSCE